MMIDSQLRALEADQPELPNRESKRVSLESRLADGYSRIDEALLAGSDVAQWESFWIKLLREYEDVCRELDIAA
jgi:hypothetical protein